MANEVRKTDVSGVESVFQEIKPNVYNNILDETHCTAAVKKAPAFFFFFFFLANVSIALFTRKTGRRVFYSANILLYLSARTLRC